MLVEQADCRNAILRALPPQAFAFFFGGLEPVALPRGFRLADQGRPARWAYFPEAGMASVIRKTAKTWQEVGVFGREGAGPVPLVSATVPEPNMIVMQIAGAGYRIPTSTLLQAFRESQDVQTVLLTRAAAHMAQIIETAVANTQFNVVQRLARWLLMAQDRIESNHVDLTHDYLALMLGVSRTGVTLALKVLETAGWLEPSRSRILITERSGLVAMIGDLYTPAFPEEAAPVMVRMADQPSRRPMTRAV